MGLFIMRGAVLQRWTERPAVVCTRVVRAGCCAQTYINIYYICAIAFTVDVYSLPGMCFVETEFSCGGRSFMTKVKPRIRSLPLLAFLLSCY